MKKLFICLLFIFLNILLFSQTEAGRPFITNYTSYEYKAFIQNWSVYQDDRGIIYFGNGEGILEYDGENWNLYPIDVNFAVKDIKKDSFGRLYIASLGEFGYAEADSLGKLKYYSLSVLTDKMKNCNSDFLEIELVLDYVYFFSKKEIFRYKILKNGEISKNDILLWQANESFQNCFVINDEFYVQSTNKGLFKIQNDSLKPAPGCNEFINLQFNLSFPIDNQTVILGHRNSGLYFYNPFSKEKKLQPFLTEADSLIKTSNIRCGLILNNKNLLIGFGGKGCVVLNPEGEIQYRITSNQGLQNESVIDIFEDKSSNLWLALNNGISKVETSEPIRYWDKNTGLTETPEAIIRHQGVLYIATHRGVFYIENSKIKKITEYNNRSWSFISFQDPKIPEKKSLIVGLNGGVYEIRNFDLYKVQDGIDAFELFNSKKDPNLVYVSYRDGFASIKYENGKWVDKGRVEGINENIRGIIEDEKGEVWLGTFRKGVIRIIPSDNFNKPKKIIRYNEKDGIPSLKNVLVYYLNNKIVFGTEGGLYKFDKTTNRFIPDSTLTENLYDGSRDVFSFIEDKNKNIWVSGLKNRYSEIGLALKQADGSYRWDSTPFKRIPAMVVLAFYVEDNGTAWIGGSAGLFKYVFDSESQTSKDYISLIRKVIIGNDSSIFNGMNFKKYGNRRITELNQDSTEIKQISYNNNTINFTFTAVNYLSYNKYLYKLEGFTDKWSQPTELTQKEYSNLNEGYYTFRIKCVDIYGLESSEATYQFEILPPWYRTTYAYIGYFVLGAALILCLIIIFTLRLKKANIKLERIISERTAEIKDKNFALQLQQSEIVTQNEELRQQSEEITAQRDSIQIQNTELEKLSIVASKTDNSVVIADNEGNIEWVNEGFTRLLGLTLDEFTERYGQNLFDASLNKNIKKILDDSIKNNKSAVYSSKTVSGYGNELWLQTTLTPILDEFNKLKKIVAIDSDITKIKRAEKNIQSSIQYAKSIQKAILPRAKDIKNEFDTFIIFKPKDVVSGDFYWFAKINNYIFIAVADCTGHGVPGAFMSMIGNTFLNEIVSLRKIIDPKTILTELHSSIRIALKQEFTDNTDGMDICLCRFEKFSETAKVVFSGAKRPLLYYSNESNQIVKIKGNRRTIGGAITANTKPFSNFQLILSKGDTVYLTTDGFSDQNNNLRKSFGNKRLVKVLEQNVQKPMITQKILLENKLKNWQGSEKQRDDINIIGLKM